MTLSMAREGEKETKKTTGLTNDPRFSMVGFHDGVGNERRSGGGGVVMHKPTIDMAVLVMIMV